MNPGDAKATQQLRFALDFRASDRSARFEFLDLQLQPAGGEARPLADRAELEAVKPCLQPVVNGFLQSFAQTR
jgi:hypothetical protein